MPNLSAPATKDTTTAPPIAENAYHGLWQAQLDLTLQRQHDATRLTRRRHHGPLLVQRPFYPEGPKCSHIYLLHPPGGLVGGDRLVCNIDLREGAHGLVTTPAAGKVYRVADHTSAARKWQGQHSFLQLAPGATLEWFPQETIVFDGAQGHIHTRIDFAADATVIGWDMLCLGRPQAGEQFNKGEIRQNLELHRDNQPLVIERALFEGGDPILTAPWGLQGQPVVGTLYAYHPELTRSGAEQAATLLGRVRDTLTTQSGTELPNSPAPAPLLAATLVNDVLIVRYLGASTEQCRSVFVNIWQQLRPELAGCEAHLPRIWNT